MTKFIRTSTLAGAAAVVVSIGVVAGTANGEPQGSAAAPKGPERQVQIATEQATELKLLAEQDGAVVQKVSTTQTAVGAVTETRFVRDGQTVRVCVGTVYAAGGGAQACRGGGELTKPLVIVDRLGADAVTVSGVAPAATPADVTVASETGATVARGVQARSAAVSPASSETAAVGVVASQADVDAVQFRDPKTGSSSTFSLENTVAALDVD